MVFRIWYGIRMYNFLIFAVFLSLLSVPNNRLIMLLLIILMFVLGVLSLFLVLFWYSTVFLQDGNESQVYNLTVRNYFLCLFLN